MPDRRVIESVEPAPPTFALFPHAAIEASWARTSPFTLRAYPSLSDPRWPPSASLSARRAHRRARLAPAAGRAGKVRTVVRAEHQPGINMAEGDADALNKWSRKITQPKSQGASQVRQATHQIRIDRDRF